jgi:putative acetyltransferase
MIIRKFQPEDLEAILQLFQDVVHTVGAKYYNAEQLYAWAPKDSLNKSKWIESLTTNITYIAEDKNTIIGFGDMTQTGYIDHLYVHKNYQGAGAALALFRALEKEARTLHLTELTTEASIIAMPLAKRQGFEVIQEQIKLVRGVKFITYKMRKNL